jgi:hypothetical protein
MPVEVEIICGFCGEPYSIWVDPSGGETQSYVEDCAVCCRPNQVSVYVDPQTGEAQATGSYQG